MTTETEALIARYIDRVENILGEIAALNADLKEIGTAVKSDGLDYPLIKRLATIRLKDKIEAEAEKLNTLGLYARAAGMQLDMFAGAKAHEPKPPRSPAELVVAVAKLARTDPRGADAVVKVTQALAREPAPSPHDPDTGEVIEPAAAPNTSAAIPVGAEGRPSKPRPDAVPPADVSTLSGQSGQALTPIPVQSHIIREAAE